MVNTSQVWQARFDAAICYGQDAKGEPYKLKKRTEVSAAYSMNTNLAGFTIFYTALINHKNLSEHNFKEMTSPQIRIKSRSQFGPLEKADGNTNDAIRAMD